jgi:16S rRNA (cytidine1402-2'-O)-methyltransferase
VSREISKKFEETVNGTITEVLAHFQKHPPKGEFVVVLEGCNAKSETYTKRIMTIDSRDSDLNEVI